MIQLVSRRWVAPILPGDGGTRSRQTALGDILFKGFAVQLIAPGPSGGLQRSHRSGRFIWRRGERSCHFEFVSFAQAQNIDRHDLALDDMGLDGFCGDGEHRNSFLRPQYALNDPYASGSDLASSEVMHGPWS